MRSIKPATGLLFVMLAASPAQNITSRAVFVGREPITNPEKGTFLGLSTPPLNLKNGLLGNRFILPSPSMLLSSQFDSKIDQIYSEVTPEKSILINDCKGFCEDPFFSFGRIVGQAARSVGMSAPETAAKIWYDELTHVVPDYQDHLRPWSGQAADQFQLLAVVNRLDFAEPTSQQNWGKAELRFVYGARMTKPKSAPEPFTVIVEFVLPDLAWKDLRNIAGEWYQLRTLDGTSFATGLEALLQESWSPVADKPASSSLVRIRTNSLTGGGSAPWFFAQWELSNGTLNQALLTDELYRECTRSDGTNPFTQTGCPRAKPSSCAAYRPMYDQFAAKPGLTFEVKSSELLPKTMCYFADEQGMDGPRGICGTAQTAGPEGLMGMARKVLSLQQCSNCHGAETNNADFVHIQNRYDDVTQAKLSRFLTGTNRKPTQSALSQHLPGAVFTAQVDVTWPGSGSCAPSTATVLRYFNDLARRCLFLAALLVNDSFTPPNSELVQIIKGFGSDMTH